MSDEEPIESEIKMTPESVVELIVILRDELQAYRARSREAVLSVGALCVAVAYFILTDGSPSPGTWIAMVIALPVGGVVVCWFLVLTRGRGHVCRAKIERIARHLEPPGRDFDLRTSKHAMGDGDFDWKGSVTALYVLLIVLFVAVTLAITYQHSFS